MTLQHATIVEVDFLHHAPLAAKFGHKTFL
jgi:hypothetical protein